MVQSACNHFPKYYSHFSGSLPFRTITLSHVTLSDLLQGYLLFWQILFHNLQSSLATIVSQPVASCWQLICVSTNELLIYYIIRSHSLIVYYLDDRYWWIYINITVRTIYNHGLHAILLSINFKIRRRYALSVFNLLFLIPPLVSLNFS